MKTIILIIIGICSTSSVGESSPSRLHPINIWLEKHLSPAQFNKTDPVVFWTGGTRDNDASVYPFRPLFGDMINEPTQRPILWLHRRKQDSVETSLWSLHSLLDSKDSAVCRRSEAWLTEGYLLFLWGAKLKCQGPEATFPYPAGEVRERIRILTSVMDSHLRDILENTPNKTQLLKRIAMLERWIEPPVGWKIEDVQSYFNQMELGGFGRIRIEFVFPLSWHVVRHKGQVGNVVKHYDEDMDYECNQLLGGLGESKGITIDNVWMTEAYQHYLAGKMLVDGVFPPWVSAEDRASMCIELSSWLDETQKFCESIPEK